MAKGFRSISPRHRKGSNSVVIENEELSDSNTGEEGGGPEDEESKAPPLIFI